MRLSLLSLAALALAGAAAALDQIEPVDRLDVLPTFSVMQVFPDLPDLSGTVLEDFRTRGVVTSVSVAFALSRGDVFDTLPQRVTGWRISLWADPADAATSGPDLAGNALATVFVPSDSGRIAYRSLNRNNSFGVPIYRADITGLALVTAPGRVWIGAAPTMRFEGNGQVFIQQNDDPADRGGGGALDASGVNPAEGWGLGKLIPLSSDAAYAVTSVPEPASLLALAGGLGALAWRRRARR